MLNVIVYMQVVTTGQIQALVLAVYTTVYIEILKIAFTRQCQNTGGQQPCLSRRC